MDVYVVLRNYDNEGWTTCAVAKTFEEARERIKVDMASMGSSCSCYLDYEVEHWELNSGMWFGTTEIDLENI